MSMKNVCLIALLLTASLSMASEPIALPNAPEQQTHPATPKSFWALTGLYTASVLADGITTHNNISKGCVEVWSAGLYGQRPTNARFYATAFGIEAGAVTAGRYFVRSHNRVLKMLGWGMLSTDTEEHFRGAIHNMSMSSECGGPATTAFAGGVAQ
jgi:hypothetical protein